MSPSIYTWQMTGKVMLFRMHEETWAALTRFKTDKRLRSFDAAIAVLLEEHDRSASADAQTAAKAEVPA